MAVERKVDFLDRERTRKRLKKEKPAVYAKLIRLDEESAKGQASAPVIEIAYRYDCNLKCKHCFAGRFAKKERSLSLADMKDLSRQANELGAYQFILQGGEPLSWPDFDEVVKAINPKEFYMGLVTNASLLDRGKIARLRDIGIDKIAVSLDSYDAAQYESNRNRQGLFNHTVDMLIQAKEAGLRVIINALATKQNVRQPQLLELIEFAKKHGFMVYVNFAAPIGNWEGQYGLLLDKSDSDYIYSLNQEHQLVKRDVFAYMGVKVGCPALRRVVYITQYGDVLACPFVHIAIGSIFDEPLSQILKKGMKIKWFKNRSRLCLACEDMDFIKNKIAKTYGKPSPASMDEIFTEDELR